MELQEKIARLYAAIGATQDGDLAKYKPRVRIDSRGYQATNDFSGGASDATIQNLAFSLLREVSDLADHLRKWARLSGRDGDLVDAAIQSCPELAIVLDLANVDKHAGQDRKGGRSNTFPELRNVQRVLRVSGTDTLGFSFYLDGRVTGRGGDGGTVVVTGDVRLANGHVLELTQVVQRAVERWEDLFGRFGIKV